MEERLLLEADLQVGIGGSCQQVGGPEQGDLADVVVDRVVLAEYELAAVEEYPLAAPADSDGA